MSATPQPCDLMYSRAASEAKWSSHQEPTHAVPVGSADFGAVQQIALADDADEIAVGVANRCAAYALSSQKFRNILDCPG
jgi:hypothetical protein